MAFYIAANLICDRCGHLIGQVQIKYKGRLQHTDETKLPEGAIADDENNHYCTVCAEKYKQQLGL